MQSRCDRFCSRITTPKLRSAQADILPCGDLSDRMRFLQHLAEMGAKEKLPCWAEGRSVIRYGSWVAPVWLTGCSLLDSEDGTSHCEHSGDRRTLLVMKLTHCPYHHRAIYIDVLPSWPACLDDLHTVIYGRCLVLNLEERNDTEMSSQTHVEQKHDDKGKHSSLDTQPSFWTT